MLFLLLAFGFWMRDSLGLAVFCVAGATLLGWPFCVVLTAPLALHALYSLGLFKTIGWGVAALISFVVSESILIFERKERRGNDRFYSTNRDPV